MDQLVDRACPRPTPQCPGDRVQQRRFPVAVVAGQHGDVDAIEPERLVDVRVRHEVSDVERLGVRDGRRRRATFDFGLVGHQRSRVAQQRLATVGVDLLVLEVQRQRLQRSSALNGGGGRAPAAARSLAACPFERGHVVGGLELSADVVVLQLAQSFGRHVDAHSDHGIVQTIGVARDGAHHVLGGVITFYLRFDS